MIRINLMPRAEARRQAARQRERQVLTVVAVVLALVILIAELVSRRRLNEVHAQTQMYKTQLAELQKKHQEAIRLEKTRAELEAKLRTIGILERQRRGPARVLADLSDSTPDKLWLTEMRESGGSAMLVGRGLDNQTIAQFMEKLGESPYFANVDLVETKHFEEGKAKLKEFSIRSSVVYAGASRDGAPSTAPAGAEGADGVEGAEGAAGDARSATRSLPGTEGMATAGQAKAALEATQKARDAQAPGIGGPAS